MSETVYHTKIRKALTVEARAKSWPAGSTPSSISSAAPRRGSRLALALVMGANVLLRYVFSIGWSGRRSSSGT